MNFSLSGIETIEIEKAIDNLKTTGINKRLKLLHLFQTHKINDEVLKFINSQQINSTNSTYWIEGGLPWFLSFYNTYKTQITDILQKTSIIPLHYRVHYIYKPDKQDKKEKKDKIISFLQNLQSHLLSLNIQTEIIEKEIDFNQLFKQPAYHLKLIFKGIIKTGGVIKYNPNRRLRIDKLKRDILKMNRAHHNHPPKREKKTVSKEDFIHQPINYSYDIDGLNELLSQFTFDGSYDELQDKILVEFYLEFFNVSFDISNFVSKYIVQTSIPTLEDTSQQIPVNILNDYGLLTYSLTNKINLEDEFSINVDNYRQNLFYDIYLGKNNKEIQNFLTQLLNTYKELFKETKSYNTFFIEAIEELINKYSDPNYEVFRTTIDRWFVSKFRSSINGFIIEINKVLFAIFGIKLFIAGGDAMRRYSTEISFTSDIDTKLYIANIDINRLSSLDIDTVLTDLNLDDDFKEKIKNGIEKIKLSTLDEKSKREEIKELIIGIIAKYIVKLRNYLEQNIEKIFNDLLQYDKRTDGNKGTQVISFTKKDGRSFHIDILFDSSKGDMEHFRVREIKNSSEFPVGLYSIDFRIYITEKNNKNEIIRKFKHDISILDVVLQDNENDNYEEDFVVEVGGIPIASLKFLLKDLNKTFTSNSAYGRLSSGKFKKDIKRYNILKKLSKESNVKITDTKELYLPETDISSLFKYRRNHCIGIIYQFLIEKKQIEFLQTTLCKGILEDKNVKTLFQENPRIKLLLIDILFFKSNFYNETLSSIDTDYYDYKEDTDYIRQNYYRLFSALCSKNNKDGLLRHSILFQKSKIKASINQLFPSTSTNISKTTSKRKTDNIVPSSSKKGKSVPVLPPVPLPTITTRTGRSSKPPERLSLRK